ncbi:hypothetical protein B0H66DRAFT_569042 [Apodospora peruviana]|uniref:Uncharacterized protein n=1 Tax=Apodospora peruviana TaxID=516989 RepID=A0AAE0HUM5_9PEZI|nr:hypothetical protein B0H66DRAFT_569042 [Apodospora peruviana]
MVLEFPSGFDAVTTRRSAVPKWKQNPTITAASLLPVPIPPPRAWQRVAVPAVGGHSRQRKIWKRVGGCLSAGAPENQYAFAIAELERQGEGARKRVRHARFVPAWGDARWDSRVSQPLPDGKWDLIEARVSVSSAKKAATAADALHATSSDDGPRWVPRKRHNSRWPIEPKPKTTRILADLQPLIEFKLPPTSEPVEEVTQQMDAKQMRRRSTRRLSRRISLLPEEEESPRKLAAISLSPVKNSASALSPVKRPPVTMSPTKVAESPLRSFRVNATPTKVVLESPKASPPARSPLKSSPVQQTQEVASIDARLVETVSVHAFESVPLIFDQPVPDIPVVPKYETRRRLSLQSARRTDRRSSGTLRLVDFESVREAPSRRHSFGIAQQAPVYPKSRRSTLDTFYERPEEVQIVVEASESMNGVNDAVVEGQQDNVDTPAKSSLPAFEVDVGTNLDIFGQARRQTLSPRLTKRQSMEANLPAQDSGAQGESLPANVVPTISSPVSQVDAHSGTNAPLSLEPASSVLDDSESADVDQAATSPSLDAGDAENNERHILSLNPPSSNTDVEEPPCIDQEACEPEFRFAPHDPEGLPTIYEEESAMDLQNLEPGSMAPAQTAAVPASPPTLLPAVASERTEYLSGKGNEVEDVDLQPEAHLTKSPIPSDLTPELSPVSQHHANNQVGTKAASIGQASQDQPEMQADDASPSVRIDRFFSEDDSLLVLAHHEQEVPRDLQLAAEATACRDTVDVVRVGALSPSDSSDDSPELPTAELSGPRQIGMEASSSPTNTDESIVTPENDFCGTISLNVQAKGQVDPEFFIQPSDGMETDVSNDKYDIDSPENDTSSLSPALPQNHDLPQAATLMPEHPGTPTRVHEEQPHFHEERANDHDSPQSDSSGFTPINIRQISPPSINTSTQLESPEDELEEIEDDLMTGVDEEVTTTMDDDCTLTVVEPLRPENDTLTLQAYHDDSETEMLRKFVTRVTADKNAKAAAAAAEAASLSKKVGRPKRRSGSTGSTTTTSTGSPIAKSDTPVKQRTPLAEKSLNSPSPLKKRKVEEMGDDRAIKGKEDDDTENSMSQDSGDGAPKLKRRRKLRADTVVEELCADNRIPNLADPADSSASGPRRSTRARSNRIKLKSAAPSANYIAMSMYPVRLPGGMAAGMMDDTTTESHLTVSRNRSEAKELEAVTRVNTRKNKGSAVLPKLVLARYAEDPAAWRMKELKGVFDAKESRAAAAAEDEETTPTVKDGRKTRKGKGVRWAEELVRYQTNDRAPPPAFRALSSSLLADVLKEGAADEEDELAMPTLSVESAAVSVEDKSVPTVAPMAVKKQTAVAAAVPVRRTRSSRLPPPTPIKKLATAGEKKTAVSAGPARSSSKTASSTKTAPAAAAAAAAGLTKASSSTSTKVTKPKPSGMATRRSKIATLGMSVNGTPAPKRGRGRPPAAASQS